VIIDAHVHLLPRRVRDDRGPYCVADAAFGALYSSPKAKLAAESDIITHLDRSGFDKAVVFGFPWADAELIRMNNDEVWDFHARFPQRIIPFAVLCAKGGDDASSEASRTLEAGFRGLGELAVYDGGWNAEGLDAFDAAADVAAAAHAPVLIHVNEPVGHAYPGKIPVDFSALVDFISRRRGMVFILAHWGGGLLFYALMKEVSAILSRTLFDTAASPFLYNSRVFDVALRILGPDRIVFGTDFPLLGAERYLRQMDEANLSAEDRSSILGGAMARLLAL
jgi:predicted TIM-barrel fold metal-dependent hydrolase